MPRNHFLFFRDQFLKDFDRLMSGQQICNELLGLPFWQFLSPQGLCNLKRRCFTVSRDRSRRLILSFAIMIAFVFEGWGATPEHQRSLAPAGVTPALQFNAQIEPFSTEANATQAA
jgi:hypothetical protein